VDSAISHYNVDPTLAAATFEEIKVAGLKEGAIFSQLK